MGHTRRSVLRGGGVVGCVILAGCQSLWPCLADIACFDFQHEAYDDVPDILTITHTGGDSLPAEEVFITKVAVDYGNDEVSTVAWYELSDTAGESDAVDGDSIEAPILFPEVVRVLWRHDGEERVVGETRSFR